MTEVFVLMRNNAVQNRNMYDERVGVHLCLLLRGDVIGRAFSYSQKPSDSEKLLQRSLRDAEEGLEMRDDYASPPVWIDKLEEAQYTISK